MRNPARAYAFLALLMVCLGASASGKQLAVIVDKTNNVSSMSSTDLAHIFRLDKNKWPNGKSVVLVLRDPATPEMQTAIHSLYHMTDEEFRALLNAHRTSFIIAESEQDLLKQVESIPGAVGLVDVYSLNGKVNVLKVDGKLPLEQGYTLKSGN
ncbi:MAG TPA: hypothetical protein VHN74_03545 [Candidatus Angelobacter sp.]|jgi:hypothetical protein|nr:hypothetical protein [Candidatus Angelobacter sp.]